MTSTNLLVLFRTTNLLVLFRTYSISKEKYLKLFSPPTSQTRKSGLPIFSTTYLFTKPPIKTRIINNLMHPITHLPRLVILSKQRNHDSHTHHQSNSSTTPQAAAWWQLKASFCVLCSLQPLLHVLCSLQPLLR